MNKNTVTPHISIKIASPEEVLSWSHGEVVKPETLNYRTQRPEKDGLFSERIFGPTKDYECYCGKYKKVRYKGLVCEKCGVEVTRAIVRRERMAHIQLASPVAHIWFLRTIPSKLSILMDLSVAKLEKVIYYAAYIVTAVNDDNRKRALESLEQEFKSLKKEEGTDVEALGDKVRGLREVLAALRPGLIITEGEYFNLSERFADVFEADRGAGAVRKILERLDLKTLIKEINKELEKVRDENRRKKLLRRLKLCQSFIDSNSRPEWMIMTVLPVLPPDLRPMVALEGGRYATADLNDLYRRVINRNNRLKKLMEIRSPEVIITNEKRMLQEAVDALIDNSSRVGGQLLSTRNRPLKSLGDMLKGKQGRFRQNLLGKRVDYSARSVIAVGPELKLNQCGLPKSLALELFRHFVINKIIERNLAYNIKQANRFIEQGSPEVWEILEEVIKDKRVLLNRAPTLHRLGIQAFKPILVEGLAIRIPPLVCTAFNADFDGDQMAVHLPLTIEAQYEAAYLMDAGKNLLKPASGDPIVTPTQDVVLGVYFLTRVRNELKGEGHSYSSFSEVEHAYEFGFLDINSPIKIQMDGQMLETTYGRLIFNQVLPPDFGYVNDHLNKKSFGKLISRLIEKYDTDTAAEYLDRIKDLGFRYATISAITWAISDSVTPKDKKIFVQAGEKKVEEIHRQFKDGLLTDRERYLRVIAVWDGVRDQVYAQIPKEMNPKSPLYAIIDSGARGSWAQPNQMMGMKGLVANTQNEQMELPIKSSFKEGLGVLEYFISTHGARKGTTDTALKTAKAGYLTRRLVDVAQDLIVQEEDCGTKHGITIHRQDGESYNLPFADRVFSHTALEDIKVEGKKVVSAGEIITKTIAKAIQDSGMEEVMVRSPITCETRHGICTKCYGLDLSRNKPVEIGEAVGIVAAQSIGEPGTQLTMRTFHVGGVGGTDITHGLPRVEEIVEVRPPKGKASLIKRDGVVSQIEERGLLTVVKVRPLEVSKKKQETFDEYPLPNGAIPYIKEGDDVKRGTAICSGPLDLKEILAYRGVEEVERYIINEIQKVYTPQGSAVNDKHIEVIVRQILSRVLVRETGDSNFMIGDLVEKLEFLAANRITKEAKKQIAKAAQKVMGITRVSLNSSSFLSAASFQETGRVLVNVAVEGKKDLLRGLKENVIIGRLVPIGTGKRGIPEDILKAMKDKFFAKPDPILVPESGEVAVVAAETPTEPKPEKEA
jgi:DNA-directed RNA polymerase subunit beta'